MDSPTHVCYSMGNFHPSSRTEIYIRFADVDMMNVVHHSAYIHWFEQIRFNLLEKVLKVAFQTLVDVGVVLPLTDCQIKYKKSFRFGDKPVGFATFTCYPQAKFTVNYWIFNEYTGEVFTVGSSTHCFLDRSHRLLLRTPSFFDEAIKIARDLNPEVFELSKTSK